MSRQSKLRSSSINNVSNIACCHSITPICKYRERSFSHAREARCALKDPSITCSFWIFPISLRAKAAAPWLIISVNNTEYAGFQVYPPLIVLTTLGWPASLSNCILCPTRLCSRNIDPLFSLYVFSFSSALVSAVFLRDAVRLGLLKGIDLHRKPFTT